MDIMSHLGVWAQRRAEVITGGPPALGAGPSDRQKVQPRLHYLQLLTMFFLPPLNLNLFIYKTGIIVLSLQGYFEDNVCKVLDTKQRGNFMIFAEFLQ